MSMKESSGARHLQRGVVGIWTALLLAGCASDATTPATSAPACPYELQVKINEGVDFKACRVINKDTEPKIANHTADLIVYKNGGGFDLWAGTKQGASSTSLLKRLKTNDGAGQQAEVYGSLDEVPYRQPLQSSLDDTAGRFLNVKGGNACVLVNTVSDGYTKVWVKQTISASSLIVIQWKPY